MEGEGGRWRFRRGRRARCCASSSRRPTTPPPSPLLQTYYKNKLKLKLGKLPDGLEWKTVWIGFCVAFGGAALAAIVAFGVLKPTVLKLDARMAAKEAAAKDAAAEAGDGGKEKPVSEFQRQRSRAAMADLDAAAEGQQSAFSQKVSAAWNNFRATRVGDILTNNRISRTVSYGATYKVHDQIETDDRVVEVWESAEVFDFKT